MLAKEVQSDCGGYNKDLKCNLKEFIAEVVKKLGQGLCDSVPYDTAWVARVPQLGNNDVPAFPLSLQWLRDNQLENGSWGSIKPFSPHSSTLNTLAAIIALAQWNEPEDKTRIERGVKALWDMAAYLPYEKHEGVGFELILPALQSEARKYGLAIPHECYKNNEQKGNKKLHLILSEFKKYGYSKPATWWHSLEILGNGLKNNIAGSELEFSWSMLTKGGSIASSPSATAYMLRSQRLKGVDVPEAQHYLQEISTLSQGGISQVFPIDIFELAFSLDFFLKAGFSAKHPLFKEAINRLAECCNIRENIGFSSHFKIPDSDDTAVALYVLHQAGYQISVEHLLKFFNGTHISTFLNEMNLSLSANVNVLNTLRLFENMKEVNKVIQKVATCLETFASSEEQVFIDDKWHASPYYVTSRAVFSLHGLREDIVKRCLDFFIKSQNKDGGWGKDDFSTSEETAYVSLALSYGLKHGYLIPETVLETASKFLSASEHTSGAQLWVGKVLYRPILVSESAIMAARYALAKTLELIKVKTMLKEVQLYYMTANIKSIDSKKSYHASLLCLLPKFDITEYSHQIDKVQNSIIHRLIELKLLERGKQVSKTNIVKGIAYFLRKEFSDKDLMVLGMAAILYDDILDKSWQSFKSNPDLVIQASKVFLQILQGKYKDIDTIIPLDFPKFIPLCGLFFDIRRELVKRQSDIDVFLFKIEEIFQYCIKDLNNRISNLSPSSKEYLQIARISTHMYAFNYIYININLNSFKDYKIFNEFEDRASKAARLVIDIFSFLRDMDRGQNYGNYVLIKQAENNLSLEDALNATVKLYNKQIVKVLSLEKIMQNDPEYKNNQELFQAISVIKNFTHGHMDWALEAEMYQSKTIVSIVRKELKTSDLSLIRQFFDNRVSNTTLKNLERTCSSDATVNIIPDQGIEVKEISISEPDPSTSLEDISIRSSAKRLQK